MFFRAYVRVRTHMQAARWVCTRVWLYTRMQTYAHTSTPYAILSLMCTLVYTATPVRVVPDSETIYTRVMEYLGTDLTLKL